MANRMAPYFIDDDEPQPRSRIIDYRSAHVRMDQGDHLVGKLVVIGMFLVPAILFAIIVFYAWTIR